MMTGMIHGGPFVVLREERGGPPRARVERIYQYLRDRAARRGRAFLAEIAARERAEKKAEREAKKLVPCVYCGAQTLLWERFSGGIAVCTSHHRRMCGYFPFRRGVSLSDIPEDAERALMGAQVTLYVFEKLVRQEEVHARQARN